MSPMVVSPYTSFGTGGGGVTEPWGEVARQTTISSGKLTISGLSLSSSVAVQLILSGLTVTTDDSQVFLRFMVAGSEVSTGYRWAGYRVFNGGATPLGSNAATEIPLSSTSTHGVGNASTEGLGGEVIVFNPGSTSLHKRCHMRTTWLQPDGGAAMWSNGGATLENTGAITGFVVYASSDLTGGSVILLGVE